MPPAVPVSVTSPVAKSVTDSLKTTVKLIGLVPVGSAWPAAWLMVTVGRGGVVGDGVVGRGRGGVAVAGRVGGDAGGEVEAMTVPAVVMPVTATL